MNFLKVICPKCEEAGLRSKTLPRDVRWSDGPRLPYNGAGKPVNMNERKFYDEDGQYHEHQFVRLICICTQGHEFSYRTEWPCTNKFCAYGKTPAEDELTLICDGDADEFILIGTSAWLKKKGLRLHVSEFKRGKDKGLKVEFFDYDQPEEALLEASSLYPLEGEDD